MTRKKVKTKAPPKPVMSTPDQKKQSDKMSQLDFHLVNIDKETKKNIEELTRISEEMIAAIEHEHDEFIASVPSHLLHMKLSELFEAGYKLDYSGCHEEDRPFLSIAPFDFEPEPEQKTMKPPPGPKGRARTTRTASTAQATRSTRSSRLTSAANTEFGTPANSTRFTPAITPKLVPAPMRGYKVFYSENGSPIMVNQATMQAKPARG